jgi:dipeptidyl aminopeptidase/acylaminoacyl peptidase
MGDTSLRAQRSRPDTSGHQRLGGRRRSINGRKIAAVLLIAALTLMAAGYAIASSIVYDRLAAIDPGWCPSIFATNTPASFDPNPVPATSVAPADAVSMPGYQQVAFPSRGDPATTVSGWWVPAAAADAPSVVVVHGYGRCKQDPEVLVPAGMLHRHGFAVLLIDMRNHGASTISDRLFAFGLKEYRDVLGAWDWLTTIQGVSPDRIGLYGVSGGAGTSVIATGEEQRVAAVWADSAWGNVTVGIQAELNRTGYPTILADGGVWVGRLFHGVDLVAKSPASAAALLAGRPIYIVHGEEDERIPVEQAMLLAAGVKRGGGLVEPWILPGVGHVRVLFADPDEYERRLVAFFAKTLRQASPES